MKHNFPVGTVLATEGFDDWVVRESEPYDKPGVPVYYWDATSRVNAALPPSEILRIVSVPAPKPEVPVPSPLFDAEQWILDAAKLAKKHKAHFNFEYETDTVAARNLRVADVYKTRSHWLVGGYEVDTDAYKQFRVNRIDPYTVEVWLG